jgi:hypothetical protein
MAGRKGAHRSLRTAQKATGVKRDRIAYLLFGGAMIVVICALAAAVLYGPLP